MINIHKVSCMAVNGCSLSVIYSGKYNIMCTLCLCVFDLGPLWVDRYENPYQVGFAIHPEQVDLKTVSRHQSHLCLFPAGREVTIKLMKNLWECHLSTITGNIMVILTSHLWSWAYPVSLWGQDNYSTVLWFWAGPWRDWLKHCGHWLKHDLGELRHWYCIITGML